MSILNPLFEAVAWVISRIHDALSVPFGAASGWSWGLSIVLLVMLMRLIMVPLFVKQVRSQRKMQSHMPALQEIRKKYKNDKTRLNEETMKFYKENGINPLGGCLPLIAQLPVFWSLFNVLKAIADWTPRHTPQYGLSVATVESARHAHVFGVLLSDKFLWANTGESWTVRAVILALRGGQRRHDVPDHAAERQARHDEPADARPGPARCRDGAEHVEEHDVHRAVLRADRSVLAVRPRYLLGHHQRAGRWGSSTSCSATFRSSGALRLVRLRRERHPAAVGLSLRAPWSRAA